MTESIATLKTTDGLDLYLRRWQAETEPHRWTLVLVHGLGEHGGRYEHLAAGPTEAPASQYDLQVRIGL